MRMPADALPHLGGPVAPGPAPGWRSVGPTLHGQPPGRRRLHRHTCARRGRGCRNKTENLTNAKQGWGGKKCQEKQKIGRSGRAHVPREPAAASRSCIPRDPTTAAPLAQPHQDMARLRGHPSPSSGIARCSSALAAGSWKRNMGRGEKFKRGGRKKKIIEKEVLIPISFCIPLPPLMTRGKTSNGSEQGSEMGVRVSLAPALIGFTGGRETSIAVLCGI